MNYADNLEGQRHLHTDRRNTLAVVTETEDSIDNLLRKWTSFQIISKSQFFGSSSDKEIIYWQSSAAHLCLYNWDIFTYH